MDVPMFLVMSGSMGFGKLAVFAAELALRAPERRTHCDHLWK